MVVWPQVCTNVQGPSGGVGDSVCGKRVVLALLSWSTSLFAWSAAGGGVHPVFKSHRHSIYPVIIWYSYHRIARKIEWADNLWQMKVMKFLFDFWYDVEHAIASPLTTRSS